MADKLTYSVVDNKLTIDAVHTTRLLGNILLEDNLAIDHNLYVRKDGNFDGGLNVALNLQVGGELRAHTIYVDNLVAKTERQLKEPVAWSSEEGGVEGKGLVWKHDKKNIDFFIFKKDPNRIFTNLNLDLYRGASISIDGTPMFTADTLGTSIVNSSLRKVGRLKELIVDGNVILSEHVYLDSTSGRIGIGTDHANAAFSLVDNGVEIAIGNINDEQGNIGTFTTHDLGLITDNTTRMKITKTGKIIFGDPRAANADVTINGKLFVKELIVDNHTERQSPLEFKAIGESNYGKGMIFTGEGITKQFIFASLPDQFFSTEHINVDKDKGYYIDRSPALIGNMLGPSITKSYLTELGSLDKLHVTGDVNFSDVFQIKDGKVLIGDSLIDTRKGVKFSGSKFTLEAESQNITITDDNIILGNKDRPIVHTIINGKMSIGLQTVGNHTQLDVAGNIRFSEKLFATGNKAPTQGSFRKGDIVWNDDPKETGFIGWVCIREGNPGIWRGFGQIGVE